MQTDWDEEAFVREMQHKEMMRKQQVNHEGWDGKKPTTETVLALKHFNKMMEQNNESSN